MPKRDSQKYYSLSVIIIAGLMSIAYVGIGVFLIVVPDSAFAQVFFPNVKWSYAWGAILIIYGLYRGWRAIEKYKEDNEEEEEESQYRYYDGKS
ncbi:MAG: hypothetical protein ACOVQ4_15615 [Flectobacillus sp.]|uniref:hypothetical protein n=1 Tax=Flectobacillus sp. TaxID=50419 RepID=UPI003B9C321B